MSITDNQLCYPHTTLTRPCAMLVITAHTVARNHQLSHWSVYVTAIENLYDVVPLYRLRMANSLLKPFRNQLSLPQHSEPCTIRRDSTHAKSTPFQTVGESGIVWTADPCSHITRFTIYCPLHSNSSFSNLFQRHVSSVFRQKTAARAPIV